MAGRTYEIEIARIGAQGPPGPAGPAGASVGGVNADTTVNPAGIHVFSTARQSTITVTPTNVTGIATVTRPDLPIAGVTSIASSGANTFVVTFDISVNRVVSLLFTIADEVSARVITLGVPVGFVPFGLTSGNVPTALSGLQPTAYGPQAITFSNSVEDELYVLVEDSNGTPGFACDCFQVIPVQLPDTIQATDENGVARTYNVFSLGRASRANQTFEITEI